MKKLFDAIKKNNIGEVKALVEKDFTLVNCVSGTNPKKDIGQSPLQVALKNGSFDIAEYLIGCGADINFMEADEVDSILKTPVLFDAITATLESLCYYQYEVSDRAICLAEKIVNMGADLNKRASNGSDVIGWAISRAAKIINIPSGYKEVQEAVRIKLTAILDLLIDNGADINRWGHSYRFPQYNLNPPSESIAESSRLTNIDVFIGDIVPNCDRVYEMDKEMRIFLQNYFNNRGVNFTD